MNKCKTQIMLKVSQFGDLLLCYLNYYWPPIADRKRDFDSREFKIPPPSLVRIVPNRNRIESNRIETEIEIEARRLRSGVRI